MPLKPWVLALSILVSRLNAAAACAGGVPAAPCAADDGLQLAP